ncbi:hypothetical protein FRAHR75_60083 [Frankia sp. Hr75.2]|nr:hypothetical protein FRAHR75_60083 [Frankia sp. Hr75.2]SQD94573.1 hypothetical protein FMEAI12_2670006 [Parafrankia sp. Ea1.12]
MDKQGDAGRSTTISADTISLPRGRLVNPSYETRRHDPTISPTCGYVMSDVSWPFR